MAETRQSQHAATWDRFYEERGVRFYKDRHWLRREVSELMPASVRSNPLKWCPPLEGDDDGQVLGRDEPPTAAELEGRVVGLEAGCGVGSATFPLLRANRELFVLACDFSETAIALAKNRDEYAAQLRSPKRRAYAWVADLVAGDGQEEWLDALATDLGGLHFVTLIYVLSAVEPADMRRAVRRLAKLLRPGGLLFFRDYAQGDMKQSRFDHRGRKNHGKDNSYKRGEGTFAYYFELDEVKALFCDDDLLDVLQLTNVNREIVNRKESLTMNRIWIQGKFLRRGGHDAADDDTSRQSLGRREESCFCCPGLRLRR
mmetsp:Transcript_15421/g.50445  ORF Transcript_15421/g.50445 Transcript_15421/m.50445 type:complete len:315 (-) Transcript_15421:64-1008(-)